MAKTSGLHFKVAELFANIIPPFGAISNSKQGLYDCVGTKTGQILRLVLFSRPNTPNLEPPISGRGVGDSEVYRLLRKR